MRRNTLVAALLKDGHRSDGEADIGEKHVKLEGGYYLVYVPYEGTQVNKKLVDPTVAETVEKTLADVCWGALISLEINGKYIVNVTIEADPVKALMDN